MNFSFEKMNEILKNVRLVKDLDTRDVKVVAHTDLKKGCDLGIAFNDNDDINYLLGLTVNHSIEANAKIVSKDGVHSLVLSKDIKKNEEICVDYHDIPEDVLKKHIMGSLESSKPIYKKMLDIKPGDIILWSNFFGADAWFNLGTVIGTRSRFTHVGLAIEKDNIVKVFEANDPGVQLIDKKDAHLEDIYLCIRRCNNPEIFNYDKNKNLKEIVDKFIGREYEKLTVVFKTIFGTLPLIGNNKEDRERLFCSELVAATLQELNLFKFKNVDRNPSTFAPKHFVNMKIKYYQQEPLVTRGKNIVKIS